ncbi:MAG: cyclic nucleotide-binding domain-containing protein [Anaerolineae bacterium]
MEKWHLESPLFSALTEQERRSITAEMQPKSCQKGQSIVLEGAPSEAMYFVDSGWVSIFSEQDGRKALLANLGPGSLLGDVDFLLERPYSTTAEAASEVKLWALGKSEFKELVSREPAIGIKLSLALGSKVGHVTDYLAEYRLPGIPFFTQLSRASLLGLAEKLEIKTFQRGDTICWLGEPGEAMYIVESGEIEVVLAAESDEVPAPLREGDLVGEMALLANKPYAATYRASSEVILWALHRSDFDELVAEFPLIRQALSRALSEHLSPEDRAMAEERLETIALFSDLPPDVLSRVGQRLVLQHYPQGELVFSEGDPGDSFYVIEVGEVKLAAETPAGDSTVAWLEAGDSFGEMALLTGKTRSVKALAMTDTNLWVLYKNDYDELMVEHPAISVALGKVLSERLRAGFQEARPRATPTRMRELPLLAELTQTELEDVTRRLQPVEVASGDVLFSQGDPGDRMYFIESGQVEVRTVTADGRGAVAQLGAGLLVGETALLTGKPRPDTARAASDLQLWALEKGDFDELAHKYPRFVLAISRALSDRLEAGAMAAEPPSKPKEAVRLRPPVKPKAKEPTKPRTTENLANSLRGSAMWLVSRSAGVKLRLAVVGFLILWLCGITLPATVISAISLEKDDLMAVFQSPTPTQMAVEEEAPVRMVETPEPTATQTLTEPAEPNAPLPGEAGGAEGAVILAVVPTETPTAEPPTPIPTSVPPTATRRAPTSTPTVQAAANVMGAGRPAAPTVRVFDMDGRPRDLDWANQKYGGWIEFAQPSGGACFRIVELRERSGPANVDVWLLDESGNPIPSMTLRFDWPGEEVLQTTNGEGKVGFALGMGSYIYDAHVGGPHTIRVICEYPSDVARNWGHLAGTPHDHLDIVFQLVRSGS